MFNITIFKSFMPAGILFVVNNVTPRTAPIEERNILGLILLRTKGYIFQQKLLVLPVTIQYDNM